MDLISLKDATNQRDEDIRRSLRELTKNLGDGPALLGPPPVPGGMARSTSSFANFLDSKPWNSPPSASKSYSVPRTASAHSFLEDGRVGSPSPFSVEGAASVAMLEKIIREMVTKEGQERLQSSLSELLEKSRKENGDAARKVEELSEFIKEKSDSQALVSLARNGPPKLELNFDSPGALHKTREAGGKEAKMLGADEDIMKMLQRIKESIAHSGGTSSEVKNLVRELRGEVLGMGRELGRKLDKVGEAQLNTTLDRSIEDGQDKVNAEEVQHIIGESIAELKGHISGVMRQRAEQDDNAFKQLTSTRGGPDGDEIFAVVKHALTEHGDGLVKREAESENAGLDHEGVLEAVKEGLKDFEPHIELQQFGLEREEILEVLKEGLEDYHNNNSKEPTLANIDKSEVYEAMQEALKDFRPLLPQDQIAQMREELLADVRESLQGCRPAPRGSSLDDEATRAAVIEAVKEGLANHGPNAPREIEISRDDLFAAVKASLDGSAIPFGGFGEQVLQQLHELIDGMRDEFHEYAAANGRDTEQVLDAMKDGLESLRAEVESYVDRAQDVTGKDEIVDTVKGGLEQLRNDVQGFVAQGPAHNSGNAEMLEYIKKEFEDLHDAIGGRETSRGIDGESKAEHTAEIILALKAGMDELKSHVGGASRSINGEEDREEVLEAMKEEFEQLKTMLLNANANDKSELVETIQNCMGALHAKFNGSELGSLSGGATEDIITELHAEFSQLKESLHSIIGDADRDAIVSGVRQSIDDLRIQLSADQSDASAEALGAIKEELERFRESMGSSVGLGSGAGAPSEETLNVIRSGLDEIREAAAKNGSIGFSDDILEATRGEFENLRSSIASSVVHNGSNEDVLDAVRLGLDDLTSHIDKKLDNPDHATSQHGELLDAINDGLETLRADVVKTLDKPLDMTVNYEILDTLKDGLASLRGDIDMLKSVDGKPIAPKGGEIVLADGAEVGEAREIPTEAPGVGVSAGENEIDRTDLDKMEVLLAQLQIKVEAMSNAVQDLPAMTGSHASEGTATKDDIIALEAMIKEVQDGVASLAGKEDAPLGTSAARKEDTDAIETLLRNTKAQIEDMAFPDPANVVTKDQLDAVEAVVRVTNEAIDGLAERLENSTAAKTDVAVVEILAQDLKVALEEIKERIPGPESDEEKPEPMTKADLDVLGIMCTEIKTRVNEMAIPDPDEAPSKADIEQLHGLINDFRESHDKMRDSYESDIGITAKAFDDRRKEFEDTVQQIEVVKVSLEEIKDELISKMGDGETSLDTLGETLKSLEEKTDHEAVTAGIRELVEKVTQEFERAHGSLEAIKVDHQQAAESTLEKQAEHKDTLVTAFGEKLETYFDGLMSKYDDAQLAAEENTKAMQDKATQQEELLSGTKAMADDLRLSIDTLGTTLTSFTATFPDTLEKMAEDSKTMFNKVDDTYNKLDETQEGLKYEHSITREEVIKVLTAVGGLQSDVSEHNPRFMVALKEVQALVGQHYEHSQRALDAAAEHTQAVRELQEQVRGIGTQNEELKTNVSSLPVLMPAPTSGESISAPVPEKYDDSAVHEKLDKLMGHAEEASSASTQLQRLDQIHEKVMSTAAEVSAFVMTQTRQITEDHENKEKEAEELALLLERRQVQKDEIEADITVLNEEQESLHTAVEALRAEKEALTAQKARLVADVSSLETAMHIRREELHDMDRKAEMIERRMLEGVMNQSRVLLLAKGAKAPPPKKKPQGRDLRVPSNASAASAQTVTSSVPSLKPNHALALKSRPTIQRNGPVPNTSERRIMSLNQINNNVADGGRFSPAPSLISGGPQSLKRSHSVKTQSSMRKPSWAGIRSLVDQNKENETLSEESEEDLQRPNTRDIDAEEIGSDAATERRTSYMSGTESGLTYTDAGGSVVDGITPGTDDGGRTSYSTSDLSYGTGSYLTGSEIDRRTSLGSSANGVLGLESAIEEEPTEEFHDLDEQHEEERKDEKNEHFYGPPSDSGLGTDLPTAVLSLNEGEYFRE